MIWRSSIPLLSLTLLLTTAAFAQDVSLSPLDQDINCDEGGGAFCADRHTHVNYEGEYVGHDEPAVLFYSNTPGSGNQSVYTLILPKDSPMAPKQDQTGGTYNFQLHNAFWFAMALCDTQSYPNPDKNGVCNPNSDSNIAVSTNSNSPDYVGKHAGTALLELQFYPPGWIHSPRLVSSNRYLAALTIDSFSYNANRNQDNNVDCLKRVGQEPVNFAHITRNGIPLKPANPLGVPFGTSNNNTSNVLLMSRGDVLRITIKDTPGGVMTLIEDLTSGQSGSMVAGPASGFGQVNWDPSSATCTISPYTFHPMYSTSSESTVVPWLAHTLNIAFADEIGHWEYCDAFNGNVNSPDYRKCTSPGFPQTITDPDDTSCESPAFFGFSSAYVQVSGCIGADFNFDGVAYNFNWPGTGNYVARDLTTHPEPIMFTSPVFVGPSGALQNYDQVAFEANLPGIDINCGVLTGKGCHNPPQGASFYPIFSTTVDQSRVCYWQLGGPNIQGMLNNFGGTPTAEYGGPDRLFYPDFGYFSIQNYHRALDNNPCLAVR